MRTIETAMQHNIRIKFVWVCAI